MSTNNGSGNSRHKETDVGTAARDRERATQLRADAEFLEETNEALDEFNGADGADDDDRPTITQVFNLPPQVVAAAKASASLRPTIRPPAVVVHVLSWFPRRLRPFAALVFLGAALYWGPEIPLVRQLFNAFVSLPVFDEPKGDRHERRWRKPPEPIVEPEPEPQN